MARTSTGEVRSTCSVTLPISIRARPLRPCVDSTIRSACSSSAAARISEPAEVASWLVRHVPPGQSARPMRAVLREHVEDPLSLELLRGGAEEPIVVTVEDDRLVFARPVPVV